MVIPVKLIARWPRRGDVMIVVDGDRTFLRADDVERLAQVPAWSAGETVLGDEWPEELDGVPFYTLEAAVAKVSEHAGKEPAREFLGWLDVTLPQLLAPDVVAQARRDVSPLVSFTIDQTAAQLLRNPGLRMNRVQLFAYLERCGWVRRAGDEWTPTDHARAEGFLTVRQIPHPDPSRGKHASYPRIYVTPAGMDKLRASLRSDAPEFTPALTPALFD
ncbi:phage antirepressor KilAC domain-containing protein [Microbacterium betulae]|uniref:Phage antirepressor KilAC domain-containing protein n=1 Tax=Microbacterium betulae TaxID=2981139 RepID=A0AA97I734_9MICO|nr:phage antirepressor KilAC domain-containing protein [Microbacterium sp. AB]WOF23802.1 phage antirepressor KilAC domain-containing protein [Microbacterium sp. AB]